jgi:hypothetical protein
MASRVHESPVPLILVGPRSLTRRIAVMAECEVVEFRTLIELDRWRGEVTERGIGHDLKRALEGYGIQVASLAPPLRQFFDHLARERCVPPLCKVLDGLTARRTFYRAWHGQIAVTPVKFLETVRLIHALRLVAEGAAVKEAAEEAGYSAPDQYRRAARRQRAGPDCLKLAQTSVLGKPSVG